MKRFNPEDTLPLYKRTGLKPIFNHYYSLDGDQECGCLVQAMVYDKYPGRAVINYQHASRLLKMPQNYILGLVHGFDASVLLKPPVVSCRKDHQKLYDNGFQDGVAARGKLHAQT
jgi:hypothetical protein